MQGGFSESPTGEVGKGIGAPNEDEEQQNGAAQVVGGVPHFGEIGSGFGTYESTRWPSQVIQGMGYVGCSGSQVLTLGEQQKQVDGQGDIQDSEAQIFGLVEGGDALGKEAMCDPQKGNEGGDASGLQWCEVGDEG